MSRIDHHVSAVQRRMTLGVFFDWLALLALVLAAVAAVVVVGARLFALEVPLSALWMGIAAVIVAAVGLTWWHAPSREQAAVAIDQKLRLKEKFSTAMQIRGESDPFARAVVWDAERTAQGVRPAGQFPVQFPRMGGAALGCMAIAVAAAAWFPGGWDLFGRQEQQQARLAAQAQLADSVRIVEDALVQIDALPRSMADAEAVQLARAQLEEMMRTPPPDPQATARRVMEELQKVYDEGERQRIQQNTQIAQAQNQSRMLRGMQPPVDAEGPVADAHRKMAEGDLAGALEDLKDAIEKFGQMTPQEREAAAEQMRQLAEQIAQGAQDPRQQQQAIDQMERAGLEEEQAQELAELAQQAASGDAAAQQQLQQAMQQAMQQANGGQGASQQQMQAIQNAVQQAQNAAGAQQQAQQMASAAQQVAQAMQQAAGEAGSGDGQMAGAQDLQQMLDMLDAVQRDAQAMDAARQRMMDAMAQAGGMCDAGGQGEGMGQWGEGQWAEGDPEGEGDGPGGVGIGAGLRDYAPAPFDSRPEFARSQHNEEGQMLASVLVRDSSVRGEARLQLQEAIEAAQAEAGTDVDDFRASRRTQRVMQEYFRVMADEAGR